MPNRDTSKRQMVEARAHIHGMFSRGEFKVPSTRRRRKYGFEGESLVLNRETMLAMLVSAKVRKRLEGRVKTTTEVLDFVLEENPDPEDVAPGCWTDMLKKMHGRMRIIRAELAKENADLLLHGVALTVDAEMVELATRNVVPAYQALADALGVFHGDAGKRDIRLPWKDISFDPRYEPLHIPNASMWWEVALSDQMHFETGPGEFGRWMNYLTAIAGPTLALFANSPYFGGKLPAAVSRDGLFRSTIVPTSRRQLMATLDTWLPHDDTAYFQWLDALIAKDWTPLRDYEGSDPLAALRKLMFWPVIRPVVDMDPEPHMRLEFRPLCRQPSPADSTCATAFLVGACSYMQQQNMWAGNLVNCTDARRNLDKAAQWGLDDSLLPEHHMRWQGKPVRSRELCLQLLTWAEQGLLALGFEWREIAEVLRPASEILRKGANNGSSWMRSAVESLRLAHPDDERTVTTEVTRLAVANCWAVENASVVDWASV